jgi:hypothetical protein
MALPQNTDVLLETVASYPYTKVRNILKLGSFKKQAIMTALSGKGAWHLARTMAT